MGRTLSKHFRAPALARAGCTRLVLTTAWLAGCGSKEPAGGNVVVDDTRPEPRPSATPEPTPEDAAASDAASYDAYAPAPATTACDECACTPDAHFCFGGDYRKQPSGAGASDAGPPACAIVSGTPGEAGASSRPPALGCNAVPEACAKTPTCDCLLTALQPLVSCYLVCAHPGAQIRVACPN